MTRLYLYGYHGGRRSLADMETRPAWNRLHPELRRRLVALFDASQDAGREVGFGEGWRSSAQQEQVFRSRHVQVATGGCCMWDGKRWALRPGMAHAAPPGRSFHEETDGDGFAFAADLVGDLKWMNANADRFGLRHFANVNNEPWHVQPIEFPNARASWPGQPPVVWQLPEHPTPQPQTPPPPVPPPPVTSEDDMIYLAHPTTNDPNDPRLAIYAWCGAFKVHFGDQATWRAWRKAQAERGVTIPAMPPVFTRDQMLTSGVVLPEPTPGTDRWGRVLP